MQIKYLPSAIYKIHTLSSNLDVNDAIASQRLKNINKFNQLKRNTTLCDKEICKILDVCRATIYAWKRRYHAKGLKGLINKSRTPFKRRVSVQTKETKNLILDLRKENPTYGKAKLHAIFKARS